MVGFQYIKRLSVSVFALAILASPASSYAQTAASDAKAANLPSAWSFAHLPALGGLRGQVSISRDGKHIAAITSPDGKTSTISVWETEHMDKAPTVLGSTRMKLNTVGFLKNDRLIVEAQQLFDNGYFENDKKRGHLYKAYITDLEGKDWKTLLPEPNTGTEREKFARSISEVRIYSDLPNDPDNVLAGARSIDGGDIYKVNVHTGSAERVQRASEKYNYSFDRNGTLRLRTSVDFDAGKVFERAEIRDPKTGEWQEHYRVYAKDRDFPSIQGWDKDGVTAYIVKRGQGDKAQLFAYNTATRDWGEPIFSHKLFEATGAIIDQTGELLGVRYAAEKTKTYWVNETLAAIDQRLKTAMPQTELVQPWIDPATGTKANLKYVSGASFEIIDRSDDMKYVIAKREGPSQPPEFYLVTDGTKLTLLGKSRPDSDPKALGESRLVQYKARDGLMIPAFLHLPPTDVYGPGPYKAIVVPHGGPWARDDFSWDSSGWTKYFTARGYVVIQPQFRASENWGKVIDRAGDNQWGMAMQDDLDDAAKWMIAQGYAAPDRVAMHGYSYGGYTSFVAAVRPNGVFQCAAAGAGVANLVRFESNVKENRFFREAIAPTMTGMNVIDETAKVSVPIFVYHGDRDVRVPVEESRAFAAGLKAAGKPFKYLELKDMGHQSDKWTPQDVETVLVEVESFLNKECKPGGL
jgi:dipeptidyl aminopeptidase/acylaminoacyl peptidase